jgi:outer membrane protein assembly factor BamB
VFVGSDDFNMYAVHANGTMKWAFPTKGWVQSSPIVANGTVGAASPE